MTALGRLRIAAVLMCTVLAGLTGLNAHAYKPGNAIGSLIKQVGDQQSTKLPGAGTVEVAFSPNEGAEALVIRTINSATQEIRMLTYSFTSAPVTHALIEATRRGVDVKIVADYKANVSEDKSGKARAALSALNNAGADIRTISAFAIHHDKVIVVDRKTVELGSFNYSAAAANRNSENVLVNWNNPELARVYLEHFVRNYRLSEPYRMQY